MQGFIVLPQWYYKVKNIKDLTKPKDTEEHGDAGEIDKLFGYPQIKLHHEQPYCGVGKIVMQVEDDGTLVKVASNYDSSG